MAKHPYLIAEHAALAVAIAQQGSISGAAESLQLSESAAKRVLRELESRLSAELFRQGPRGLAPTRSGEIFLEHARAILAQLGTAEQRLAELRDGATGVVRVGTPACGRYPVVPLAVAALKRARPGVRVVIREGRLEWLHEQLGCGELDLIVGPTPDIVANSGLVEEELHSQALQFVVRRGHPALARPEPDLRSYPWVLPLEDDPTWLLLAAAFAAARVPLPANRIDSSPWFAARTLVITADAIAVVPDVVAHGDAALSVLSAPFPLPTETVAVCALADHPLSASASALRHELGVAAGELRRDARQRRNPVRAGNAAGQGARAGVDEAILAAALHLFGTRGYSRMSIEEIAERAGVSRPTVYRRYKNKGEIVQAALRTLEDHGETISFTGDLRADLITCLEQLERVSNHGSSMSLVSALFTEEGGHPELLEHYREGIARPRRRAMQDLLIDAQRVGALRPDADLDALVNLVVGAWYAAYTTGLAPVPGWQQRAVDALWPSLAVQPDGIEVPRP